MKKLLLALVALGLAAAGWFFYRAQSTRAANTPDYVTHTVARGTLVQSVTATGSLAAVLSVDVGSQVSGLIKALYADYNTHVKAGQKLVELDPATYEQKVRQAKADLASARASYRLAELNAKRTAELYAKSLVTQQDNDEVQATLAQTQATLQTKEASLENAQVDLSRCTIYSPIDGMVISKATEVGKTVAASMSVPVLFTIAHDLSKMQISAAVAEADIGAVAESQKVTFTVDAFPNRTFNGEITQVRNSPTTSNNVVTYETIISVDNHDLKLRPGMTANVSIIVARRDETLRIPNASLRVRMPEGLAINAPAAAGAAPPPGAGPGAPSASATPPAGERRAGGRSGGMFGNLTDAQRQQMRAISQEIGVDFRNGPPTDAQREQMRKLMVERGVITAEQAAAMSDRRAGDNTPVTRDIYVLPGGSKEARPVVAKVRTGITDGSYTEVLDGLKEGDVIITSISTGAVKTQQQTTTNPFGPTNMRRGGGGPGGPPP